MIKGNTAQMNEFKLSRRLRQVADWIDRGGTVADVGTDHGYLPVYIAKNNISDNIIAMDVRRKPLEKAEENIKYYGVSDKIELRLSDGLEKLMPQEADTITICGIGGRLMQSILERGSDKITADTQLILSPQSEIREFRIYLAASGYETLRETMLEEDGQFYVIMECVQSGADRRAYESEEIRGEVFFRYGRLPLIEKNESLMKYLLREEKLTKRVSDRLRLHENESVKARVSELEYDLECIKYALKFFEK